MCTTTHALAESATCAPPENDKFVAPAASDNRFSRTSTACGFDALLTPQEHSRLTRRNSPTSHQQSPRVYSSSNNALFSILAPPYGFRPPLSPHPPFIPLPSILDSFPLTNPHLCEGSHHHCHRLQRSTHAWTFGVTQAGQLFRCHASLARSQGID